MSLEARVTALEGRQHNLESAYHELVRVVDATHKVVSLSLNEQRDIKKAVDTLIERADQHDRRFDEHDRRFDKIEELLVQIVNNLASK